MVPLRQIRKRDGRLVPFERAKIADAIFRAARAVGGEDRQLAEQLAGVVEARVAVRSRGVPTIDDVQDAVEKVLIEAGHAKTAKTFILYRERRTGVRQARKRARDDMLPVPLVGGDPVPGMPADEGALERLDKAAIASALVDDCGLGRPEAELVARAVEARVLASGRARLARATLAALVRAELFDRGVSLPDRAFGGTGLLGGFPAAEVETWLERGMVGRRAPNPAALAEAAGEALLARHLLEHRLPSAVAEAHRVADIHLFDLGAPHRLTAIGLDAVALGTEALAREPGTTERGPRRALAAIESAAFLYGPHVARTLALDHVNQFLAPFIGRLGESVLHERVRELLLSPVFGAVPGRGGLVRVELVFHAEVPPWLAREDTPAPALPGRTYGDLADESLRILRAFLQESAALHREGRWLDVALTVVVPRSRVPDAATRALLRDVVRTARESGEPLLVIDEPGKPTRGSRWLRRREEEAGDPLRFARGDVSVASAGALNAVAAALRTRHLGEVELQRELERLATLALEAAAARHEILAAVGDDPGGPLWPLRRGMHPLVDLESAVHAVQVVGLDPAVALLASGLGERNALRERLARNLSAFVARESAARGLSVRVVEERDGEAALRMARIDAQRYPEVAAWWAADMPPTYRRGQGGPSGALFGEVLDPATVPGGRARMRLRRRVDSDERLPLDRLLGDVVTALERTDVVEWAVDPWPRRTVRRGDDARVGSVPSDDPR